MPKTLRCRDVLHMSFPKPELDCVDKNRPVRELNCPVGGPDKILSHPVRERVTIEI